MNDYLVAVDKVAMQEILVAGHLCQQAGKAFLSVYAIKIFRAGRKFSVSLKTGHTHIIHFGLSKVLYRPFITL